MDEASKKVAKAAPSQPKVTRAQIATKSVKVEKEEKEKNVETHLDVPLIENVNRLQVEGDEARTVEEAISILRYSLSSFMVSLNF